MKCTQNNLLVYDELDKKIGGFIRKYRKKNNLSTKDLSDLTSVSQQQISRYERGVCSMKLISMVCFFKVLNISWEDFITEVFSESVGYLKPDISYKADLSTNNEVKFIHDKYIIFAS